jgi:hypothetical protein
MTKKPENSAKEDEIAEIQRRIEYLITTDQLSDSKKVSILKEALAACDLNSGFREVLS